VSDPTLTAAAALDAIDEGVLVQDSETQVVYANRAAGELLGVDRDDLRGRSELPTPSECLSESGEALPERWPGADALRTGRPQRPRVMGLQRPDGGMRWVRVSARPIGRSVLTSLLDVTALRNAEEDAATLASRLGGDRKAKRGSANGNGNGHKPGKGVLSPASTRSSSCWPVATRARRSLSAWASRPPPCACTCAMPRASSAPARGRRRSPSPWLAAKSQRHNDGVNCHSTWRTATPTTRPWPRTDPRRR
jgi:PAS domain S-box-containing protein